MISSEHKNLFWRLLEPEMREPTAELQAGLRRARDAQQVMSSRMRLVLEEVARRNLSQRATRVWELLQRVMSDVGVTPDESTAHTAKVLVREAMEQQHARVLATLEKYSLSKQPNHPEFRNLESEAFAQRDRIWAEIDLLFEKLRQQRTPAPSQPVFNFHGPVGAVQAGPNATAYIQQQIGGDALERLQQSLDALVSAVEQAEELIEPVRTDVVAVVQEVKAELQQRSPNRIRLGGLALGVATSIQTIASLEPAWKMVKAAFASVGVVLP
jgi:hypothetical protein